MKMEQAYRIVIHLEIFDCKTYGRNPMLKIEDCVPDGIDPWAHLKDRVIEEMARIDARRAVQCETSS
jgi:hypothetical protein